MKLINTLLRWWTGLKKTADAVLDVFRPHGIVEARLYYADGPRKGELYKVIKGRNIVTSWLGGTPTSGRDLMRRLLVNPAEGGSLNGVADAWIDRIQLGSGTTAETSGDTDVEIPLIGAGVTLKTHSSVIFDGVNPYVTFVFDYSESEANATISEAGLYSGPTRNDFIARKTFGAFTKTNQFTLQIRWQIRF
jgi:hypothetical protein